MVPGIKGYTSRGQFVDDAAKGPDVGMMGVALGSADFGRHVEWSTDVGRGKVMGGDNLRETKVTELDGVVFAKEDWMRLLVYIFCDGSAAARLTILRLQVPM